MRRAAFMLALVLSGCGTTDRFNPRSDYPPDPWVKGYSNPDDCLGGEQLAALQFDLPAYPRAAFRSGRQGWVIMRLDVNVLGETENVAVERALPDKYFGDPARRAVRKWRFAPPVGGRLQNCRVLIRFRAGQVSLGG